VPLRRALVTESDLPYPEGLAAAEVLKVGSEEGSAENAAGLRTIVWGSILSAAYQLLATLKLVAAEVAKNFRFLSGASGVSASFSMALIGVGHLVGVSVGAAMLVGMLIAWGGLVPWLSAHAPGLASQAPDAVDAVVSTVFRDKVRFIGAGTIGVAAIWTLLKIIHPIVTGIRAAMAASRAREAGATLPLTERDIPIGMVGATVLLCLPVIAALLWAFAAGGPIAAHPLSVIGGTVVYIMIIGVVIASVCGYMAGLIGASNSPVSGVGILAAVGASLLLLAFFGPGSDPAQTNALIAYAIFTTAIVFSVATISNDNLQDLKTGQLVGATPWKQQVALVLGVLFGSVVIPIVLEQLKNAFGFVGMPGAGPNALSAPQAALITALAQGVLGGNLDWSLIGIGAAIGCLVIFTDELLAKTGRMRLPPLGVGMGIYLPMSLTILIPLGAAIGHLYDGWGKRSANPKLAERMGTLTATGLIVGESLYGVGFSFFVAARGGEIPAGLVGPEFTGASEILAAVVFFGGIAWLYRRSKQATISAAGSAPG
jgi:putative OPT family oligopeptide transporter